MSHEHIHARRDAGPHATLDAPSHVSPIPALLNYGQPCSSAAAISTPMRPAMPAKGLAMSSSCSNASIRLNGVASRGFTTPRRFSRASSCVAGVAGAGAGGGDAAATAGAGAGGGGNSCNAARVAAPVLVAAAATGNGTCCGSGSADDLSRRSSWSSRVCSSPSSKSTLNFACASPMPRTVPA
eukprot:4005100-Prymnesium_polylepis.1